MKHDMTQPCDNCPFRTDVPPYIRHERVIQIRNVLANEQGTFPCHKTTDLDDDTGERHPHEDEQQCAGAMILLMKEGMSTQMMRIDQRLGHFNPDKLNMDAPVYDSFADMVAAHRPRQKRKKKSKGPPGGAAIWTYITNEHGGTASMKELMEHFECEAVDIENCLEDDLPEGAEGLDLIVGFMGGGGAVRYDDEEQEVEAY